MYPHRCLSYSAFMCASVRVYMYVRACNCTERILNAGTQVISALQIFQEEVAPCLPPDYAPMDTFISAFEEELVAHIESEYLVYI